MTNKKKSLEQATLGGGCFWCIEAIFEEIQGVKEVVSGYAGGKTEDPTYEEVCTGQTGHAEVVQLTYDPDIITYRSIVEIFLTMHNPTTINRQGSDVGNQYRSIILYHSEEQKEIAVDVIEEFENKKVWNCGIVTQVVPFKNFYKAEDYHQDYYLKNKSQPYCKVVIDPKIKKLKKEYKAKLKL